MSYGFAVPSTWAVRGMEWMVGFLRELRLLLTELPPDRFYVLCALALAVTFVWWFR
jgi:hypothetical protein